MKKLSIFLCLFIPFVAHAWDAKTFHKPTEAELKQKLSSLEFKVTQKEGTETPFANKFWKEKQDGIYVDVVSGEPLFSSLDKYDSGTGWPSFTRPLVSENIVTKEDNSLFTTRTEVRSKHADSHLGHVFTDGPKPTGLRYCMNSAALRFIPKSELKQAGYGEYLPLFAGKMGSKKDKAKSQQTAIFAGGCFWCMQPAFDKVPGVLRSTVGYTGGHKKNPTYHEVSEGTTGHKEAIEVAYDANKVSYNELLDVFWHNVDPLDAKGQFCDKGDQYQSAIFYLDPEQKNMAEASLAKKQKQLGKSFATELLAAKQFYPAEDYHQDYYKKNPLRYKFYRFNCGRDQRLKEVWGSSPH